MSKMLNLIKNELIKVFSKNSNRVAFIVLMAIVLLVAMVGRLTSGTVYYEVDKNSEEWWEHEAEWLEEEFGKKDQNGEWLDKTDLGYENRATAKMYRFLIKCNVSYADWRYDLVSNEIWCLYIDVDRGIASDEENARLAALEKYCIDDDWRAYYTDVVKSIEALEGVESKYYIEAQLFPYEYRLENDLKPYTSWRDEVISQAADAGFRLVPYLEADALGENASSEAREKLENTRAICMYRLENDIEYNVVDYFDGLKSDGDTFWGLFALEKSYIVIIGVILIVLAGEIVADEYSKGTIKFLLISPAKRVKIIAAKYFTVAILGIAMLAAHYVASALFSLIFSGGKGIGAMLIEARGGVATATSPFLKMLSHYALQSVSMIVMATMAFAISALSKNAGQAVAIGLLSYFFGFLASVLLPEMGFDIGRYLIFSNLDLAAIAQGKGPFPYQTLGGALAVIAVHMFTFLIIAHDAFVRKDI